MDVRQMSDATLITMLNDAGMKEVHGTIRAELERRQNG